MEYGRTARYSAPVLSLTIVDQATLGNGSIDSSTLVLVVVRDPNTNRTHPNVVSVPTQRIPSSLYKHLLRAGVPGDKADGGDQWYKGPKVKNCATNGHHPLVYAVESLLARKLGVSEQLEMERLHFSAELRLATTGQSYHLNMPSELQVHHISMANAVVTISEGAELFPSQTASYSRTSWVEVSKFIEMVKSKNPMRLDLGLDPIEHCVHGMCISSSYEILARAIGASIAGDQDKPGKRIRE